jgi:hypothetical protein
VALPHATQASQDKSPHSPLWIRVAFWLSIAISVAVVIRRLAALAKPATGGPPQLAQLDSFFASHAALTLAHIVPALLFVLVAPLIVFPHTRPVAGLDRTFYILGAIVGLTAYAMSFFPVGGWTERSAVLLFDSLFLVSLVRAFIFRRRSDHALERRWQLRSIAILLGIATTRPVMGVFFATARLTHLVPAQFFGIAFWIGFSLNVFAFELWIRSVDSRRSGELKESIRDSQARRAI